MVSKRFALLVVIRIVLLMLTMTALAFIFARTELFFNQLILLGIIIIQVSELIRFITYTNREIAKLLMAIRYSDFSISFKGKKHGKSFQELQDAFVEIIDAFKKVSVEKEAQFKFLKVIVDNIKVGVLAVKEDHGIELMNKAAQDLLKIATPNYWKQLQQLQPAFTAELDTMEDNERRLIELSIKGEKQQVSVQINRLKILNYRYTIVTFQDIKSEIEQKEIEAWHKLIRILTHEIMNSVTPVTSLSETMLMMLEEKGQPKPLEDLSEETLEDLRFSLKTIQKRSEGLLHFVEDYRKLTRIKALQLEEVNVNELLVENANLLSKEFEKAGVELRVKSEAHLKISMDRKLVDQVLINLLTNARHATEKKKNGLVQISAYSNANQSVIEIQDNGIGIDETKMDQIFIPFFSTKENGSGIGLSLSKQIMKKHKGDLTAKSQPGLGATFSLIFRS
ncbi:MULTISPECIES: ATP-binding protein [Roseivirga]|uniref:histidine kinase n=1 Tax=Roseivirga thermotolerans TaxID=1758176 RepID=A0ABQ3ICE1_9BACT|nr:MULTISPECIES: ATP-binding protein [Roseivirga]MEC7753572.1 ATP-binding protein [Bacteroidota bacterium]GHE70649.1 histidine kinase [Roseivirga thermotolerans]